MTRWLALALLVVPSSAKAATVRVNPGGSIDQAIVAAACGDTIEVAAGTYDEHINAWKVCTDASRIHVKGLPGPRPVVRGPAGRYAIGFYGVGFVFEHLELTSTPDCSVDNRVAFGNGSYFDFVDVLIRDGGYDGFGTYCGANHIRLVDSEVRRNGLACDLTGGGAQNGDGVDLFACRDCEVLRSHIHGNNLYAVQIKGGAKNVAVRDSILESESGFGIVLGRPGSTADCPGTAANAEGVIVTRNVLRTTVENGWSIEMLEVTGVTITHNTLTIFDNLSSPGGQSGGFLLLGRDLSAPGSALVRNNIFDNRGLPLLFPVCHAVYDAMRRLTGCTGGYAHAGLAIGNNLYFGGGSAPPDGAATSLVGDPRFIGHPADLHLAAGSPAIDRGADLGDPYAGSAPDLGAFETMAVASDGAPGDGAVGDLAAGDLAAGGDAGGPNDAAASGDRGTGATGSSGGCGCVVGDGPAGFPAILVALVTLAARRKRQR